MRRLYVTKLGIHNAHRGLFHPGITTHWLGLTDTTAVGWHDAWVAAGQPVVTSTDFTSELSQDLWQEHCGVTVLPHPLHQPDMKMHEVMAMADNLTCTWNGIAALLAPTLHGIQKSHTVIDVHTQLTKLHKGYKLRY